MPPERRTKGEGSIYQRASDGRWVGVVDLGWVGGKRVRRTVSARTLREARVKFRALKAQVEGGVTGEDVTVEAWFTLWLDAIASRRVRPRTLDTYRGYVRAWVIPYLGRHRLSKLRAAHIEALYDAMRKEGRADATVRQVHAIIKRGLTDAVQREQLVRNPADVATAPKVPKGSHHAHLGTDDARKVLGAAQGDTERLARVVVAILLGLRQSEALGLRWSDLVGSSLAIERGLQRLKGKGLVETELKTQSSRRVIPVPPGILAVLEAWRVESGGLGYVFGGASPTDPREDYEAWRAACIAAGVTPVPLHGARASTVTLLIEAGVPVHIVSAIAGHSDVSVTLKHYARSDPEQMSKALAGMDAMLELLP